MTSLTRFSEQDVLDLLEKGATLVTVNRRLARFTLVRYGERQVQGGRAAWETPDVLPLNAWLERCWDRYVVARRPDAAPAPLLLGPHQERMVWKQVITESDAGKTLLHPEEAAAAVEQAWRLCRQWRIPMKPDAEWASADPAAFLEWAEAFESRCRRERWMDRARLADAVAERLENGTLDMPGTILFHGFDDISPQMTDLIETLRQGGCRVGWHGEDSGAGNAVRVGFVDADAEIAAAARWVRHRLRHFEDGRIGVIVPRLESRREQVARVFDDILHPEALLAESPPEDRIYNISLGPPLSDYPVIRTAFSLLHLITTDPDVPELTSLLLSPYIAGSRTELPHRAVLDASLRKEGAPRLSVDRLLGFMDRLVRREPEGHHRCPELHHLFTRFRNLRLDLPEAASPGEWTEAFTRVLDAFGWPGDRKLKSAEYQIVAAWQEALARFAELGRIVPMMAESDVLAVFHRMVADTPFQPEGRQVPVQVMGMLEAAGERFDALWILGMKQDAWPPAPSPNPFVPMVLQRRLKLPHATPERELDYARQVTGRLLGSARQLVVSYPVNDGDSPCYPSPLIEHLPETRPEELASDDAPDYRGQLAGSAVLEQVADWTAPPLEDSGEVAGGTGVIKAQAACPFCACVGYRFGAKPLEQPVSGLDAAARGKLVHRALELVWDRLKTHDALVKALPDTLEETVAAAVAEAIRPMAELRPETFTERFTALEQARLHSLLLEWLDRERERMPFEVIEKEANRTVEVGEVRLNTWVDRIDRLDDGRKVIIDYKTGRPKMADWFTERLIEPQLPLYSVSLTDPLGGVFFAQVRKGDTRFIGLADDQGVVDGIKAVADAGGAARDYGGIAEIRADWKDRLESLAKELRDGHAPVAPVSVRTSCQYCHLACVCRIGEYEYLEEVPPDS